MEIDSYDLFLDVNFEKSVVKGSVMIAFSGATNPLKLDATAMKVDEVLLDGRNASFVHDAKAGTLSVRGVKKRGAVVVNYTKVVSDDTIFGLYKSKYGPDHLLATDLEPAEARSVFPCKDHPAYKAVFRLTVVTEKGLKVIANTSLRSVEAAPEGRTRFKFEDTPRMSTYLFFFGVGKFDEEEVRGGKTLLVGASRPGQAKNSRYVLEESAAVLEAYGKYFGIPFPLKKLHLVALPEYHTGAMENWGAIASRESYVLMGEGAGVTNRRRAVHVMAHEIAHQWFGDLVTMKWWDDVWLNESFATFMDDFILDKLHPDWDCWDGFLRSNTFRSLGADSLSWTHPIQTHVKSVSEIGGVFDAISYGKGAAVLRMLEAYMGEEKFGKGVSAYLKKFSYSNASGRDFWESLGKASGLPVKKVAESWITKAGFPLVRVESSRGKVKLSQSRFRLDGKKAPGLWPVPLTLESGGRTTSVLLEKRSATLPEGKGRTIVNPRRTGFYSVLYDQGAYKEFSKEFANLHTHDKAGIVNDLYLFMHAGLVTPAMYFKFVLLSAKAPSPLLTLSIVDQMTSLRAIAGDLPPIRKAAREFASSQLKRLGLTPKKGEDETYREVREAVVTILSRTDDSFASELAPMFKGYGNVDPELKAAVATSYARTGGEEAFSAIQKMVKTTDSEIERARLYSALVSSGDSSLVEKALEMSISGAVSRSDSGFTITGASLNPDVRPEVWAWLKRRYAKVYDLYGGSQQFFLFMNMVVPRCAVDAERDAHEFISGKRFEEGRTTFRRTFETLAINVKLRQKLRDPPKS